MNHENLIKDLRKLLDESPRPLWIDIETTDLDATLDIIDEATNHKKRYLYNHASPEEIAAAFSQLVEEKINLGSIDEEEEEDESRSDDEVIAKLVDTDIYIIPPGSKRIDQIIYYFYAYKIDKVIITFNAQTEDWLKENAVKFEIPPYKKYLPAAVYDAYIRAYDYNETKLRTEVLKKHGISVVEPVPPDELGGWDLFKEYMELISSFKKKTEDIDESITLKGILLMGIPGTGKSLAAKVVGSYLKWPVVNFSLGELLSQYVGESEHLLKRFLKLIESLAPIVLYIDEIEKMFHSTTGDPVTPRLIGELLKWMQETTEDIFIVATANAILGSNFTAPLPPELIRHGRFNKHFFADVPPLEEKLDILEVFFERYEVPASVEDIDRDRLGEATEGFTGAELEDAVEDAKIRYTVRGGDFIEHLFESFKEIVPITHLYSNYLNSLREYAIGRFKPVSTPQKKLYDELLKELLEG